MPLFKLTKKNKTKDQLSSASTEDADGINHNDKASTHSATGTTSAGATTTPKKTDTTSSANQKSNKAKSDKSSSGHPVRTVSNKTHNPFAASPVNIPKSSTLAAPSDLDSSRMFSTSPLTTSPSQPPPIATSNPEQQQHPQQPHLQNVVTGQYNAPPTPPSTARSGSIDDKIDSLAPNNTSSQSFQQRPQHDEQQLKQPQSQQSYHKYSDIPTSDAMIGSSSGLLTPVSSASDRSSTSHYPTTPTANAMRVTKGKYSITDFSILRTLGTGSFGRVHLVQSRHNSRFYAIKVSDPHDNLKKIPNL